jgi:paraquat-inducible protein A
MADGARSFLLGVLIVAASVCLVLGLTLPIVRLTRFYVWTDVHSMISIVAALYNAQEIFLAGVICLFSVIFPFAKLIYLLALYSARQLNSHSQTRFLRRIAWLGKWSMLDVLVLALVIFYAKSTNLADAMSMPGIYMFAAAVMLTMAAYSIVEHEAEISRGGNERAGGEGERRRDRSGGRPALHPVLSATPRAKVSSLRVPHGNSAVDDYDAVTPASLPRGEPGERIGV